MAKKNVLGNLAKFTNYALWSFHFKKSFLCIDFSTWEAISWQRHYTSHNIAGLLQYNYFDKRFRIDTRVRAGELTYLTQENVPAWPSDTGRGNAAVARGRPDNNKLSRAKRTRSRGRGHNVRSKGAAIQSTHKHARAIAVRNRVSLFLITRTLADTNCTRTIALYICSAYCTAVSTNNVPMTGSGGHR